MSKDKTIRLAHKCYGRDLIGEPLTVRENVPKKKSMAYVRAVQELAEKGDSSLLGLSKIKQETRRVHKMAKRFGLPEVRRKTHNRYNPANGKMEYDSFKVTEKQGDSNERGEHEI